MSKKAALRKTPVVAVRTDARYTWAFVLLTATGLLASGYLSYTYLTSSTLYCAGIGNCEVVHASAYAKIFGVPIAYAGLASYVALAALLVARSSLDDARSRYLAILGVQAVAIAGTVFSAYLTYVEFFVINAICPWCVVSAIAITGVAIVAYLEVRAQLR